MSFDFGLTLPTTMDYQQNAGDYWGRVHARAQQEWSDQRGRDAADRDGRMQRDIGRGNLEAYRQRRSQFDNQNSVLQGLHRGDQTPYAMPNAAGEISDADRAAGNRQFVEAMGINPNRQPAQDSIYPTDSTLTPEQRERLRSTRNPDQTLANLQPMQLTPNGTAASRSLISNYQHNIEQIKRGATSGETRPLERTLQRMVTAGIITQAQATSELGRVQSAIGGGSPSLDTSTLPWDQNSDAAFTNALGSRTQVQPPGTQVQGGAQTTGTGTTTGATQTAGAGTSTALPADYLGTQDTSGPLQMTPDMQLMDDSIQDSVRNAEIYARYGRNDLAEQHMNLALTGQAGMHQQQNILLLRGVAEGNMDAAARLAERLSGRPPGIARFVPTPEDRNRYVLVVRGSDGVERNISQTPSTREEIYASFEAGVDATGVAQRRAASAAVENNIRDNNTDIYVADRNFQANVLRTFTEAETARFEAEQRRVQAAGGQLHVVSDGDGGIYTVAPVYNDDGTIDYNTTQIRVGEVQTPGTNGTTTTQGLIVNRATGTGNTTARTN
jgi:hypothetical protein